jgi:DNA modification methylase
VRDVLLICDVLDGLSQIPDNSVACVVTSPPYWGLRDYGMTGQIGLESTPQAFVCRLVEVFEEVRRVLKPTGTLWLNLGDTYNAYNGGAGPGSKLSKTQTEQRPKLESGYGLQDKSLKPKDLIGIPWRVALALQHAGWYLRSDIIWSKPNPMPESVRDRPTKAHEYVFLMSKSERYFYDHEAVQEPASYPEGPHNMAGCKYVAASCGDPKMRTKANLDKIGPRATRNKRTVWTIPTTPYPEAHFATFPEELARTCILAGCPEGGTVLDPFAGSGTTLAVAKALGRSYIGIELNPEYAALAQRRLDATTRSLFALPEPEVETTGRTL